MPNVVYMQKETTKDIIREQVALLKAAKEQKAEAEDAIRAATNNLSSISAKLQQKTLDSTYNGAPCKVTVVTSERVKYDEAKLEKALGEEKWEQATIRKIDPSLLKTLLLEGDIQLESIADYMTVSRSSPSVRVTTNPQ